MDARHADLYEADFHAWAVAQAAALRRMAAAGAASELDLANLAEEVEGLARSERHALDSHLETLFEHLLKLEFSPAADPRPGWKETATRSRNLIRRVLRDNPSLRPVLASAAAEAFADGRRVAARALERHGEDAAALAAVGPDHHPLDRVLDDDWFPANRHGLP